MSDTSFFCYLNIEYPDPEHGYWHARIGGIMYDLIDHARLCEREWAITVKRSGDFIVIAQSKNWRDRTGEPAMTAKRTTREG